MSETFGHRLRRLRESKQLSVRRVAQGADLSSKYIIDLEAGHRTVMTPESATRLAAALGVSLQVLNAPVTIVVMTGHVNIDTLRDAQKGA